MRYLHTTWQHRRWCSCRDFNFWAKTLLRNRSLGCWIAYTIAQSWWSSFAFRSVLTYGKVAFRYFPKWLASPLVRYYTFESVNKRWHVLTSTILAMVYFGESGTPDNFVGRWIETRDLQTTRLINTSPGQKCRMHLRFAHDSLLLLSTAPKPSLQHVRSRADGCID